MSAPSVVRAAPTRIVYFYLAVIVVSWAGNWPLMKLALGQVPPLIFVLLRLSLSVALIAPGLAIAKQPLLPDCGERTGLFWVGQLQKIGRAHV